MEAIGSWTSENIDQVVTFIAAMVSIVVAFASIAGAFRAGVLKRIRFGSLEIESSEVNLDTVKRQIEAAVSSEKDIPFEIEQLARYYSQVLAQSKISFWFSLVFASLGFAIIVVAAFLYNSTSPGITVAQFIAGTIMDAVAGLFFVQSRAAQESMSEFFDKLRKDRMHIESRNLCDTIEDSDVKDALKVRLALYYAGIENDFEKSADKIVGSKMPAEGD